MIEEIKALEEQYSHILADPLKRRPASLHERCKDAWTTGPDKSQLVPAIPQIRLDYDTAKRALWVIMYHVLTAAGKEFYIYQPNIPKLNDIIRVMVGDTSGSYDVTKGIYMYGRYSHGKTWMMEQLRTMLHKAYYTGRYTDMQIPMWISYKTDIMMRARAEKDIAFLNELFKGKRLIFIDDIGYEEDSQLVLFGNRENVIVHLVDILHKEYLAGAAIHFTSNLQLRHPDPATACIYKRYGQGTYDRLMQMCTPVLWSGDTNLRTGKKER